MSKFEWDQLWINARIATCASDGEDYGLLENAAIATHHGKIAWMGRMEDLSISPQNFAQPVIDCTNKTITPGLIDCHTHLVYGGDRTLDFSLRLHGASYAELAAKGCGIVSTVKATAAAEPEELYKQSAQRLEAMLSQGTTTVEIKSGYGLTLEQELKQLHTIQALARNYPLTLYPTFLAAHALPAEYRNRADAYIDYVLQETLPQVIESKLALAVDAFCETIAFSPAQVERIFAAAKTAGLAIKLHAEQLSDSGGAELASRFQALSADHLEFISEGGIDSMAAAGTVAVLLPGAFYFLREKQAPPIAALRNKGVVMALATDCNPGTSPLTSLPLAMNLACVLWQMRPAEALRAVTINAARALGLQEIGSLEVGKQADFVVWDMPHPDHLSYAIGGAWAKTVIKKGKLIYDQQFPLCTSGNCFL